MVSTDMESDTYLTMQEDYISLFTQFGDMVLGVPMDVILFYFLP